MKQNKNVLLKMKQNKKGLHIIVFTESPNSCALTTNRNLSPPFYGGYGTLRTGCHTPLAIGLF